MYHNLIVEPLYNLLIFIINNITFADLGFGIIILTVLVKLVLFPISKNAIKSQMKMREIAPKVREIQEKHKDNRQAMALEMMNLYKQHNIKPFSSMLLILLQIPIILALYFVFYKEGLPAINTEILYSFINAPQNIDAIFLNIIDLTQKSYLLAVLVGLSQFFQAKIMFANQQMPATNAENGSKEKMMEDIMKGMQMQMKYFLPVFMMFISFSLGAAVSLYFVTSSVFAIFQELYLKKERNKATL